MSKLTLESDSTGGENKKKWCEKVEVGSSLPLPSASLFFLFISLLISLSLNYF
jgi:hypothetical protein